MEGRVGLWWGGWGAELVVLDVVHRLARGDLGQSLAGAPQLPRDLARTHLRRVEHEGKEGGMEGREVEGVVEEWGKEKHEVEGNKREGSGGEGKQEG